jgi:hypothetical protein
VAGPANDNELETSMSANRSTTSVFVAAMPAPLRRWAGAGAASLAFALVMALDCAPASAAEIVIGQVAPLSGVLATTGQQIREVLISDSAGATAGGLAAIQCLLSRYVPGS